MTRGRFGFEYRVDVSVVALTKYWSGHSDVLMGAAVGAGSAYLIYKLRKPIIRTKNKVFR